VDHVKPDAVVDAIELPPGKYEPAEGVPRPGRVAGGRREGGNRIGRIAFSVVEYDTDSGTNMKTQDPFLIGTRGSPMALMQAAIVRKRLAAVHRHLDGERSRPGSSARRDWRQAGLHQGNRGVADNAVDIAVHSVKDVATWLPDKLEIACLLPRNDPRDVFLSRRASTLTELPKGALVGTSSPRRQAQVLERRPDLKSCRFAATPGRA